MVDPLLGLYASLGEAAAGTRRDVTAAALRRSQAALLDEHLWPWLPCYLDAVADGPVPALAAWATLSQHALRCERPERSAMANPATEPAPGRLPFALRAAPGGLDRETRLKDLVDALVTPARSGMILTRARLAAGAEQIGVGLRIGERRFALRAVLEQDPPAALAWLAGEAHRWQRRHAARGRRPGQPVVGRPRRAYPADPGRQRVRGGPSAPAPIGGSMIKARPPRPAIRPSPATSSVAPTGFEPALPP